MCGAWLVHRGSGRRVTVMVWDGEASAEAGMAAIGRLRARLGDRPRPTPSSMERVEVYGSVP